MADYDYIFIGDEDGKGFDNKRCAYISFTDIVLKFGGSLNSFSEEFLAGDKLILDAYHAAELYVK